MATFNSLATELQVAIWQLVLPYRGIHWVDIEGQVHDQPYLRDSIRFTRQYFPDGNLPDVSISSVPRREEHLARFRDTWKPPGMFFERLVPVVPSVWGSAGPGDDLRDRGMTEELAVKVSHERRCRQLSTYTQVAALLATCRLSRTIALEYLEKSSPYLWEVYRSKGPLHRTRPLDVWESQYSNEDISPPDTDPCHTPLVPKIRAHLDLVVLRLHDSHGRATPTLRQGPFQFSPEALISVFPWFNRVGIEWHPRWADERAEFRAANVHGVMTLMNPSLHKSTMLYWLVDDIPRPNWARDYPEAVPAAFNAWMGHHNGHVFEYSFSMDEATKAALLSDCDLDLEFEANGRRYYVVFVVVHWEKWANLDEGLRASIDGPFLGGEAIWPEKLRAPARFAYDMLSDCYLYSLGASLKMSFILSWEPI